jgi:hypothetical protein
LYIGHKNPLFRCNNHDGTGTKEHPYAKKICKKVSKLGVPHDIAVAFNHGNNGGWEPTDMGSIYGFIESLMQLHHCAMFSFGNVYKQYEYDIKIGGNVVKCLHIAFDTESG